MKNGVTRREFLQAGIAFIFFRYTSSPQIITVNGSIPASKMGTTLIHEHFLVDFIGAEQTNLNRWNREEVAQKVLPYLLEAKKSGVKTIFDCTPAYLGRDVVLIKLLSDRSGLQVVTNTGYYGAVGNKYLPPHAFTETDQQLARRWISEYKVGIDGTPIKPGFIKIGVEGSSLSGLHKKIVRAAALTHLETGLTICSHTGPAVAALEQIDLLTKTGVHPSAFVWTHAQAEKDRTLHIRAARMGAWISLDGIAWSSVTEYADSIANLKSAGLLHKVLISHDGGWYKPGEKDGGSFTGYTNIFTSLIPVLMKKGFTKKNIRQLLEKNPVQAFSIKIRKHH